MKEWLLQFFVALTVTLVAALALPWFFGALDYSIRQSKIYFEVGK